MNSLLARNIWVTVILGNWIAVNTYILDKCQINEGIAIFGMLCVNDRVVYCEVTSPFWLLELGSLRVKSGVFSANYVGLACLFSSPNDLHRATEIAATEIKDYRSLSG